MTPNESLSIPNALKRERPDDYYKNTTTIEWPLGPDGSALPDRGDLYLAVVFKGGGHVATAKEFVRFLVAEGWLAHYLDFSGERLLPPMPKLLDSPFWLDPSDPHRMAAVMQISSRPMDIRLPERLWRLAIRPDLAGARLGEGGPSRRRRRHQPRAGGRRGDRPDQADPGGVTAPQRLVPLPTCDLGRSPAFPRFLASKAPCNGRYGMGWGEPVFGTRSDARGFLDAARQLLSEPEMTLDLGKDQNPAIRGQAPGIGRDLHRLAGEG